MARTLEVHSVGGCGGFGMNSTLFVSDGRGLLVDFGIGFPRSPLPGIMTMALDAAALAERAPDLVAIILTHAHDDHCAGLAHLPAAWRRAPLCGPPLAVSVALDRLRDAGGESPRTSTVALGERAEFGPFRVRFLPATHSIPDNAMLAIDTPAGLVLHAGDFKLDPHPVAGPLTDIKTLAELGRRGVRLALVDSTGARRPGRTGSESAVAPHIESVFAGATGQLFFATFATHLHRVRSALNCAQHCGRRAAFLGQRMTRMARKGVDMGHLVAPTGVIATADELAQLPPQRRLWIVGGCQGEPGSALSRLSYDDDARARVGPSDTVVVSASTVPGNEAPVSRMLDRLLRLGATVRCADDDPGLHVSGHASRDEIGELLRLARPRFVIPIHGDRMHLTALAQLATESVPGLAPPPVLSQGESVVLNEHGLAPGAPTAVRISYIDDAGRTVAAQVISERLRIAEAGVAILRLPRRTADGRIRGGLRIESDGVPGFDAVAPEAIRAALDALASAPPGAAGPELEAEIARTVGNVLRQGARRRPWVKVLIDEA